MRMKEQLKKMWAYNHVFVENEMYLRYTTSKYPDRKIAILSCMDTRMTELLPAALGIKNGDVKLIKNAGGRILHSYGSAVFSLLVAVYELGVDTILVIGHKDCGAKAVDSARMIARMKEKGITQEALDYVDNQCRSLEEWLTGFDSVDDSVRDTVAKIKTHPLMHKGVRVDGLVMDPETGHIRWARGLERDLEDHQ